MSGREAIIRDFLAGTPWHAARRAPSPTDASFRRYERLSGGPKPALLMDAPPPQEDVRPYIKVAEHLLSLGFSAPEIYARDEENGLLIIEDFGDATYTRELAQGADETELYRLATDILIALHKAERATAVNLAPYDAAKLLEEATLLTDWYMPAVLGQETPAAVREEFVSIWGSLFPLADAVPASLVHKDYHVDNLMWLEGRDGLRRVGLLDFQDAVIGPVTYDLVSLLEDARRDVDPALREAMTARYLDAFPGIDPASFASAAALLSAQRNCKIIGIFTRLLKRDGKPVYLQHIPRVWRLLEMDAAHPALAPLRAWLDAVIPPHRRVVPSE